MVHEGEEVGGVGGGRVAGVCRRSVRFAGEVGGGADVVWVLPEEGELVHEVGVAVAGGEGGDEDDEALVVVDHGLEGWPAGRGGVLRGRLVGIVCDVCGCELCVEFGGCCVI